MTLKEKLESLSLSKDQFFDLLITFKHESFQFEKTHCAICDKQLTLSDPKLLSSDVNAVCRKHVAYRYAFQINIVRLSEKYPVHPGWIRKFVDNI